MNIEKLIRAAVKQHYANFNLDVIEQAAFGLTNYNFILTGDGGERLFGKLYRTASAEQVARETALVDYLAESGVHVPSMIKSDRGKDYINIKNMPFTLSELVEGEHPKSNPDDVNRIGELIATVHKLPVPETTPSGFNTDHAELEHSLSAELKSINGDERCLFEQAIERSRPILDSQAPTGLIHSDVFLDNCIKTPANEIYLIDFEEAVEDCFLLDIGRALLGCCMVDGVIDINNARALLAGYIRVRTLSVLEWRELNSWLVFSILYSIVWRYRQFNILRPEKQRSTLYREFIPALEWALESDPDKLSNLLVQ